MTDFRHIIRDETPVSIFNPLNEDVISVMRDDDNVQHEYKIPSMEISTFPAYRANRLKVDIKTAILNFRGIDKSNPEKQSRELDQEISI